MALALELGRSADADREMRALWAALERVAVPSLATHVPAVRPHVTLAVVDDADGLRRAARALRSLIDPCPVELVGPALFATDPPILHLVVTPTQRLLALHGAAAEALDRAGVEVWPHYRTDAWVPHCTLSMGVPRTRAGDALAACLASPLPLLTTLADPRLTDSETGEAASL